MTRVFSFMFDHYCNLKPLGLVPPRAREIAPGIYRLPVGTDASDLVALADRFGVNSTDEKSKRQLRIIHGGVS